MPNPSPSLPLCPFIRFSQTYVPFLKLPSLMPNSFPIIPLCQTYQIFTHLMPIFSTFSHFWLNYYIFSAFAPLILPYTKLIRFCPSPPKPIYTYVSLCPFIHPKPKLISIFSIFPRLSQTSLLLQNLFQTYPPFFLLCQTFHIFSQLRQTYQFLPTYPPLLTFRLPYAKHLASPSTPQLFPNFSNSYSLLPNSSPFPQIMLTLSIYPPSSQTYFSQTPLLSQLPQTHQFLPTPPKIQPFCPNYAPLITFSPSYAKPLNFYLILLKLIPFCPTYLLLFIYAHLSFFFPTSTHFSSFPNLCRAPPLTSNYAKPFDIIPSLCSPIPFMSNYAHLSTFPPLLPKFPTSAQLFLTYAKIIRFFSILPNLSPFAPVMPSLSAYVPFCPFIQFCLAYVKCFHFYHAFAKLFHSSSNYATLFTFCPSYAPKKP